MNKEKVSIYIPAYNAEKTIKDCINSVINQSEKFDEIIVIDDNSSDKTFETVDKFSISNSNLPIRIIKNKYNMGLGRSYIDTAFVAKGNYYMLVNGDNAEPGETIYKIITNIGHADMVIPYFGNSDSRKLNRVIISKLFTFLINLISGYSIKYYNGPVVHKRYNVMRWSPDTHGFAYQAEIIVKVLDEKGTYKEVEIKNYDRQEGISKAFTIKNIFSIGHSILQIFLRRLRKLLFYRNI